MEFLEDRTPLAVTPFAPDWVVDLPTGVATWVQSTASDSNGNLVVLGRFDGTVDFDPGPGVHDLTAQSYHKYLAKYDAAGGLINAIDLGDTLADDLNGVAIDNSGAVYFAASYWGKTGGTMFSLLGHPFPEPGYRAMFVAKLDSGLETVQWLTTASLDGVRGTSGGQVDAADLAVDSAGSAVYVNGLVWGKGTIGPLTLPSKGTNSGFISKLNGANGQFEWVKLTGSGLNTDITDIAVDPSDANAIYHSTSDKVARYDSSGNQLWERSYANASWNDITARDGGLFLAGSFSNQTVLGGFTLSSSGGSDALVARLAAATGNVVWATRAGGNGTDDATGIAADATGNLFVGGSFDGIANFGSDTLAESSGNDAYVSQLDAATGSFAQSWRFGRAGADEVVASAGSAYVVGGFNINAVDRPIHGFVDFPNGYMPTGGADEQRTYLMHFSSAANPTVPRINGFVATPNPVEQGGPLSLSVVGIFDPDSRVDTVSFYRDVNLNRRLDIGTDVLVGVDDSRLGGWGIITSTALLALGDQQFLAQATYDGSDVSLVVSSATFVREPIGAPVTYHSSDVPKQIRDLKTIVSTLSVPDSVTIGDVDVLLTISHSSPEDLDVYLIHPNGTRVELFTDVGGYWDGGGFEDTTLDDDAPTAITAGQQPFTGRYRPDGLLSALDGKTTTGAWKLEIRDDSKNGYGTGTGQLNAWAVTITPGGASAAAAAMVTEAESDISSDHTTEPRSIDLSPTRPGTPVQQPRSAQRPAWDFSPADVALEEYAANRPNVIDADAKSGRPLPRLTIGFDSPLIELLALERLAL